MVMCFVPGCNHYSEKKICKFFTFPADLRERKKWIVLIRRQDREPSKHSLVCSCHFVEQNRKNGPTIFEFNKNRKLNFESPKRRKRMPTTPCIVEEENAGTSIDNESMPSTSKGLQNQFIATVEAENYFLKQELEETKKKLKNLSISFSYEYIKNNDSLILMYTGIPTNALFLIFVDTMVDFKIKYYAGWNVVLMPKVDQILITLMKLRLNLPHEDIALRFNCSTATVTNIVMTWIYAIHEVFFKGMMKTIPSRKKNKACLPAAFVNFKNCRIILDCTEIYSIVPTSMDKQRLTYSSYKHRNTWKVLVGVAPNGVVTFVSEAYPGSTSDKQIVENSGVLKLMVPGDLILADKGFLIQNLLPTGVSLNIPPFLSTPQFSELQVFETQKIAKARIHVERAIRRIKCYQLLNQVPQYYLSQISIIFQVCASLTNFQYPLIKEVEEYYKLLMYVLYSSVNLYLLDICKFKKNTYFNLFSCFLFSNKVL